MASGYVALKLGDFLVPVLQIPGFDKLLAILAAFDAFAVVCIVHVKRFRGPTEQYHTRPIALSLMYLVIGLKCALGMGVRVAVWIVLINTVVATLATFGILRLIRSPPDAEPLPPDTGEFTN